MAASTVRVTGLKELNRAINKADRDTQKLLKAPFKRVGEIVRADAESKFSAYDSRSAGGYRVKVQVKGVKVEQSLRKVTGKRGDYGALQMRRAMQPALDDKQPEVIVEMNKALDEIADIIRKA